MASLWEVDPIQISALANAQYPTIGGGTGTWQFIFPDSGTSADGDIHVNMAINSGGTGRTGANSGESPIVPEVINATNPQLTTIDGLNSSQTIVRGIFRYYTEHFSSTTKGERKFEIHPATELLKWNGSAFAVVDSYRPNIKFDNGNTSQSIAHMTTEFDGSDIMTAAVMVADSNKIVFTYPSPRFNYCIYDGVTLSGLTNDFVSSYFLLKPNLVPTAVIRCRLVTNTIVAAVAAGLVSNQTVTVNALTRCDLLVVSNRIASLAAGQTGTFTWPVEFITLNITNLGAVPPPVALFSGTPTNGPTPLTVTFTDGSTGSITNRSWDFGNGDTSNTTATTVLYTYNAAGTNTVRLIVSGLGGSSTNSKSNYIVVSSELTPPSASFSGNPTNGTEPLAVTFSDTSTGNISNRFWDFGDSSTTNITTNSVVHVYAAGAYPVTLIVTGPDGTSTNTKPNYIMVLTAFQSWQVQYFGSTDNPSADPNADPDGDGFSNLQEYLTGTDPTNSASAFRITSVIGTGSDIFITWETGLGKTNALESTAGTGNGNYDTNGFAAIFTVTNTASTVTNFLDMGAATNFPSRYYRLRLVP